MTPIEWLQQFYYLYPWFSAVLWAMYAYLVKLDRGDFEPKKLLPTLCAALTVALLQVAFNIEPDTGEQAFVIFLVNTGIMPYINRVWQAVWKLWLYKIFFGWLPEEELTALGART